jgi:hypothetical protein
MSTRLISVAMLLACTSSCVLFRDPMTMSVVRGGRSKPIGIILDSPEVRSLVRQATGSVASLGSLRLANSKTG